MTVERQSIKQEQEFDPLISLLPEKLRNTFSIFASIPSLNMRGYIRRALSLGIIDRFEMYDSLEIVRKIVEEEEDRRQIIPEGLPKSWISSWNYTFTVKNGHEMRETIRYAIERDYINDLDYSCVNSGTLEQEYQNIVSEDMAYPIGLPTSWKESWNYTLNRSSGKKRRDAVRKALKSGEFRFLNSSMLLSGDIVDIIC